jgi:hypothetical protein
VSSPYEQSLLSIRVALEEDVIPAGTIQVAITNNYRQPVTAYVISREGQSPFEVEPGGEPEDFQDITIWGDRAIMPGETGKARFREGMKPIVFEAALFADGTHYGDDCWAGRIVRHRRIQFRVAKGALAALEKGLEAEMSLEELIDFLAVSERDILPENASQEDRAVAVATFARVHRDLRLDPQQMTLIQRVEPVLEWLAPLLVRLETSKPAITDSASLGPPPLCKDMTPKKQEQ